MTNSNLFKAIKSGNMRRTRKPDLIHIIPLRGYLPHAVNHIRLAAAIAYSMTTPFNKRNSIEWLIAKGSCNISKKRWESICVFSLLIKPEKMEDILIVDFSILSSSGKSYNLPDEYPNFKKQLLEELYLIWKAKS